MLHPLWAPHIVLTPRTTAMQMHHPGDSHLSLSASLSQQEVSALTLLLKKPGSPALNLKALRLSTCGAFGGGVGGVWVMPSGEFQEHTCSKATPATQPRLHTRRGKVPVKTWAMAHTYVYRGESQLWVCCVLVDPCTPWLLFLHASMQSPFLPQ